VVETGAAPVTWHPFVRRSRRIGEALQTSPTQMRLRGLYQTHCASEDLSLHLCGEVEKSFD
jgi:hypothetical protein